MALVQVYRRLRRFGLYIKAFLFHSPFLLFLPNHELGAA